jgi:replicative DNA helicase
MAQPAAEIVLHEIDVERALLGSLFAAPDSFGMVAEEIGGAWFSDPLARYMFEECVKLSAEGHTLSTNVIISMLPEDCNGTPRSRFYAETRMTGVAAGQIGGLIATLKDRWARRQLLATADVLKASASMFGQDPFLVAGEAIAELDGIASSTAGNSARRVSMGQAASAAYEAANDRIKHGVISGITWGLADLDRVTKLYPGELTIAAARPSMGKTTLGLHTCLAAAKAGEGVLFVSLEMGDVALGQRALSATVWNSQQDGIPYTRIREGDLDEYALQRLEEASARLAQLPLIVEQEAGLTVLQIAARARKAKRDLRDTGQDLSLLVVDHLGLIAAADRYAGARHLELGAITSSLKALAKELAVPVLLLCQLSRGVEGRDNKRPMLSDLRESGRIEEDADTVVLLYREAYYLERARETDADKDAARVDRLLACENLLEINVAKQRQGATRTVEAFVSMPNNVIRNAARRGY